MAYEPDERPADASALLKRLQGFREFTESGRPLPALFEEGGKETETMNTQAATITPQTEDHETTKNEEAQPQPTWLGATKGEVGLWVVLLSTSALVLGVLQVVTIFENMFAEIGFDLPVLTKLVLLPAKHPLLAAFALVTWVATAALARKRRKAFVAIVIGGVLLSLPVLVFAFLLPLLALI